LHTDGSGSAEVEHGLGLVLPLWSAEKQLPQLNLSSRSKRVRPTK
jgi:hypothetical protein